MARCRGWHSPQCFDNRPRLRHIHLDVKGKVPICPSPHCLPRDCYFPKAETSTHDQMLLKYEIKSCEPTLTRRGTLPQVQLQRSPPKLPAAATTMLAQYFMMFTAVPHSSGASCDDYLGEDQQTRAPPFLKLFLTWNKCEIFWFDLSPDSTVPSLRLNHLSGLLGSLVRKSPISPEPQPRS